MTGQLDSAGDDHRVELSKHVLPGHQGLLLTLFPAPNTKSFFGRSNSFEEAANFSTERKKRALRKMKLGIGNYIAIEGEGGVYSRLDLKVYSDQGFKQKLKVVVFFEWQAKINTYSTKRGKIALSERDLEIPIFQ